MIGNPQQTATAPLTEPALVFPVQLAVGLDLIGEFAADDDDRGLAERAITEVGGDPEAAMSALVRLAMVYASEGNDQGAGLLLRGVLVIGQGTYAAMAQAGQL